MILSVGGSISFAPKSDKDKVKWLDYDTRHMLAELKPTQQSARFQRLSASIGRFSWDGDQPPSSARRENTVSPRNLIRRRLPLQTPERSANHAAR
jgi:hypothetical protein